MMYSENVDCKLYNQVVFYRGKITQNELTSAIFSVVSLLEAVGA